MATFYSLTSGTGLLTDFLTTLQSHGLVTNIYYQSSSYLVIKLSISDKVFKFNDELQAWRGDAWVGSTTISNQYQLQYVNAEPNECALIVGPNYIFLGLFNGTNMATLLYIGALDNANDIIFGMSSNAGSTYTSQAINVTDNMGILPITFSDTSFKSLTGNLYTMPLMWARADNTLEMNGAVPAATLGVKVSSCASLGTIGKICGPGYLLTPSLLWAGGAYVIRSSLLVEFT